MDLPNVSPYELYEWYLDLKKHGEMTGKKASGSKDVGGEFTVSDGGVYGRHLELAGKKFIQEWAMRSFPKGKIEYLHLYTRS